MKTNLFGNMRFKLVQFTPTDDISQNASNIIQAIEPKMVVVFPEGSLSGYSTQIDEQFLSSIDMEEIKTAVRQVQKICKEKNSYTIVGTLYGKSSGWTNQAILIGPTRKITRYDKVNLATHERSWISPGKQLKPVEIADTKIGIQLCREIKYPEQWRVLSKAGASILIHLNNATGNIRDQSIWRSQLIARATENQRYVISINVAATDQKCPSMAIAPDGTILYESSRNEETEIVDIDTDKISNWYLNQCAEDVVKITYLGK